jgi:hypothetical protein
MQRTLPFLGGMVVVLLSGTSLAEEKPAGFLCCNMRTDGKWISDINYQENGKSVIPVGTPVKVTGYGRHRVNIDVEGKHEAIGNDYSRDLKPDEFMKRYVVADDPKAKIAGFPKPIQDAVNSARVTKGMTREQVLMAVGYPVSSENPHLDAKAWKFWLSSFAEFRVVFDDQGIVTQIEADPDVLDVVAMQ